MSSLSAAPEQIIHIVDDDEALRDSLVWMLEANAYRVVAHESADAFLSAYREDMCGCCCSTCACRA